jgi:hypothetical protein
MRKWLSRRLLHLLVRHVFQGITPKDFVDTSELSDGQYKQYCFDAKELLENFTYKAELQRLRYKQERYLVNKASTEYDLIFGKAVLYTIDMLEKRMQHLAKTAEQVLIDADREADEDQDVS